MGFEGADVSQFQGEIPENWFGQWDFVVIRAFDRHGNLDTRFLSNWSKAAGRTRRGAYGWPKPGADNRLLGASLRSVASDAEFGLWADFEHSPEYGLALPSDLNAYLDGIGDGIHRGIYSNIPTYRDHLIGTFADGFPWWVANYGPNDGQRHGLSLSPPRSHVIHQYTSRGEPRPPQSAGLDRNFAESLNLSMAEVWYPNAIRVNGARANYDRGRNRMECVKCHYTVGVNSYGVGVQGYFQFLVNRDGSIYQFAPVDALCWDSSEWNDAGPGIEVEYHPDVHDVIFNGAMIEAARGLVRWLHEQHGFPLQHYPASAGRIGEGYRGFIDHGALIQTSPHFDYWPEEDWTAIASEPTPEQPQKKKVRKMYVLWGQLWDGSTWAFLIGDRTIRTLNGRGIGIYGIPQEALDWLDFGLRRDSVPLILGDPIDIELAIANHAADHGPGAHPA